MPTCRSMPFLFAFTILAAGAAQAATPSTDATQPAGRKATDLVGTWDLSRAGTPENCRVLLRPQQASDGDYDIGIPSACRHAMPDLARTAHWTLSDATHLKLTEPAGTTLLDLVAAGDSFTGTVGDHAYIMTPIAVTGHATVGFAPVDTGASPGFANIVPISKRTRAPVAVEDTPRELGGRYAVMRQKHDTGCMVTLDDKSRVKGGARAQLAPGCRDQGIVIFDPTSWTIIKGELVLTARAGHKAHLLKAGEGSWEKDTKDGSKPLGLKKL